MKVTGIVRAIDRLGRYVIPKEIRKQLDIKENEELECYIENDCIVLKKCIQQESIVAKELRELAHDIIGLNFTNEQDYYDFIMLRADYIEYLKNADKGVKNE